MKLPSDTIIEEEKLTKYLSIKRARDDKSVFLGKAGYTLNTWKQLEADLFEIVSSYEASFSHLSKYGDYYEIKTDLQGPNETSLFVRTIWMKERFSEKTKFITLIPGEKDRINDV